MSKLDFPSEQDAHREAIEIVKKYLSSRDQLTRVGHFKVEFAKKKASVEAQLSSAVRTQVDTTRLGLELLGESLEIIKQVRENFARIDTKCLECKDLLKEYPVIDRVNTARNNLSTTSKLLSHFESMPQRANKLLADLKDDELKIKDSYKELRKLVRYLDHAQEQGETFSDKFKDKLKVLENSLKDTANKMEVIVLSNIREADSLADDDPLLLIRTVEVIEMDDRAKRKMFDQNKDKKVDFLAGSTSPKRDQPRRSMREKAFLEMDNAIMKLFQDAEGQTEMQSPDSSSAMSPSSSGGGAEISQNRKQLFIPPASGSASESFKTQNGTVFVTSPTIDVRSMQHQDSDSDAEEKKGLSPPIQKEEKYLPERSKKGGEEYSKTGFKLGLTIAERPKSLREVLEEIKYLLRDLITIEERVARCFPSEYDIEGFYESRYRKWVSVCLEHHTTEVHKLGKADLLDAVRWLQWYLDNMHLLYKRNFDSEKKSLRAALENTGKTLLATFLSAAKETLLGKVSNILKMECTSQAVRTEADHWITASPTDLFTFINTQFDIVLASGIKGQPLLDVCAMFNDIFTFHQEQLIDYLQKVELRETGGKEKKSNNNNGGGEDFELLFGPSRTPQNESFFLALVNNANQSQQHMDNLKEKIKEFLDEDDEDDDGDYEAEGDEKPLPTIPAKSEKKEEDEELGLDEKIEELLDDCGMAYYKVGLHAVDILVLIIMTTLHGPMNQLFTPQWQQEGNATELIVGTVEDYFEDWKGCIAKEVFFFKIVSKCLKAFVQQYIQRFTEAKPPPSDNLWARIKSDRLSIKNCWNKWISPSDKELVKEEMAVIKLIQPIVQEDMIFAQVHFSKIVERFQEGALEIVDGLLAVRGDISSRDRRELVQRWSASLPVTSPVAQAQASKRGGGGVSGPTRSSTGLGSILPSTGGISIERTSSSSGSNMGQIKSGVVITPPEDSKEISKSLSKTWQKLMQKVNETAESIPQKARELRRQVTDSVNSQTAGGRVTVPPSPSKSKTGSGDEESTDQH